MTACSCIRTWNSRSTQTLTWNWCSARPSVYVRTRPAWYDEKLVKHYRLAEPLIVQRRYYLSFIVYWLIWIVIETNMLQWYGLPAKASLTDSAITIVLLAVICILVCNILTYYQPSRDLGAYLCVLAGLSTVVWGIADRALLQSLIYTSPSRAQLLDRSMPVRFCIAFLHVACMIPITLIWKKTGEE